MTWKVDDSPDHLQEGLSRSICYFKHTSTAFLKGSDLHVAALTLCYPFSFSIFNVMPLFFPSADILLFPQGRQLVCTSAVLIDLEIATDTLVALGYDLPRQRTLPGFLFRVQHYNAGADM